MTIPCIYYRSITCVGDYKVCWLNCVGFYEKRAWGEEMKKGKWDKMVCFSTENMRINVWLWERSIRISSGTSQIQEQMGHQRYNSLPNRCGLCIWLFSDSVNQISSEGIGCFGVIVEDIWPSCVVLGLNPKLLEANFYTAMLHGTRSIVG